MTLKRSYAAVVLVLSVACGTDGSIKAVEPKTTPLPSPCAAPQLEPTYLPDGVEPIDRDAHFGQPDRTRTWQRENVVVQIGEGFSGDRGDDPAVEKVSVRGDPNGRLAEMRTAEGSPAVVVDWAEETRCGFKQYIVVTEGLSEKETLKIAQSLEGDTR